MGDQMRKAQLAANQKHGFEVADLGRPRRHKPEGRSLTGGVELF